MAADFIKLVDVSSFEDPNKDDDDCDKSLDNNEDLNEDPNEHPNEHPNQDLNENPNQHPNQDLNEDPYDDKGVKKRDQTKLIKLEFDRIINNLTATNHHDLKDLQRFYSDRHSKRAAVPKFKEAKRAKGYFYNYSLKQLDKVRDELKHRMQTYRPVKLANDFEALKFKMGFESSSIDAACIEAMKKMTKAFYAEINKRYEFMAKVKLLSQEELKARIDTFERVKRAHEEVESNGDGDDAEDEETKRLKIEAEEDDESENEATTSKKANGTKSDKNENEGEILQFAVIRRSVQKLPKLSRQQRKNFRNGKVPGLRVELKNTTLSKKLASIFEKQSDVVLVEQEQDPSDLSNESNESKSNDDTKSGNDDDDEEEVIQFDDESTETKEFGKELNYEKSDAIVNEVIRLESDYVALRDRRNKEVGKKKSNDKVAKRDEFNQEMRTLKKKIKMLKMNLKRKYGVTFNNNKKINNKNNNKKSKK